jgi:glycosyltransferase 2 family protein
MAGAQPAWRKGNPLRTLKHYWKLAFWLLSVLLVAYVVSITPFGAVFETLAGLRPGQIGLLVVVNLGIILLMAVRWWWILRSKGHRLPFPAIVRYRLAAFGVSYFTPGPQFGGEPLQVYFLHKNHRLDASEALMALTLDKLLDLLANFTFLAFGVLVVVSGGYLNPQDNLPVLLSVFVLVLLPWGYLLLLYLDKKPFSALFGKLLGAFIEKARRQTIYMAIHDAEAGMSHYCRKCTLSVLGLMVVSGVVWAALVFEFWLMLSYLGAQVNLWGVVVFITAARLAFLTPLPGGLGALEISQVMAAQALGFGPEIGASIGLLIRLRDVSVGLAGLVWGGILTRKF